jgi:hypothetical protein
MPNYDRHLSQKPEPQTRPKPQAANIAGVSQIGQQLHYPRDELFKGRAPTPVGPTDNLVSGPGGGRTICKSGGQHSLTTREMPKGRDILGDFGEEAGDFI